MIKDTLINLATTINPVKPEEQLDPEGGTNRIVAILDAIIGALGIVAVVVVVIGGVLYMTSSGDSAKVKKAKDTILYGIIGLVICALSYAIVNFVVGKL